MWKRFKGFIKNVFEIIKKPVMSILPGQLAFSFILTIIPLIILLGIIASSFSISLDTITSLIKTLPEAISGLLLPLINGRGFDLSILIYLITAFFLASGGAYSIITASDVVYKLEPQKSLPKRIKAFIMTFVLIALIMFLIIVPAFGDIIFKLIADISGINISDKLSAIYFIIKYPLSFILIFFNIKLIYTMAPNKEIKSKTVTPGALFTTITWMLITEVYSFWVERIAHYDIFYGSISNIMILFFWMYFIAYAFVIGLVMNAGIEKEKMEKV